MFVPTPEALTRLKVLNASNRSCKLTRSPNLTFLNSDVSQRWKPGPKTAPGAEFPNCPTACENAAVLKNLLTVFGPLALPDWLAMMRAEVPLIPKPPG